MFQNTPPTSPQGTPSNIPQNWNQSAPQQQAQQGNDGMMTPQYQMAQSYSHGGKTKRSRMVMAHFNPKELHMLDHLQGKTERCPKTGMRSYTHLEEILKNPHILSMIHGHSKKHCHGGQAKGYAHGGQVQGHHDYHNAHLNHLAGGGINGDSEIALIGPHTHSVFQQLAHHPAPNPNDGHPQYFSLGGALGGLWDTLKGGAQNVAHGIGSAAQTVGHGLSSAAHAIAPYAKQAVPYLAQAAKGALPYLTKAAQGAATSFFPEGGPVPAALVGGLGDLAGQGLDYLSHINDAKPSPAANAVGAGLGQTMQTRRGGADMKTALGSGMITGGSQYGGGVGGAARAAGQGLVNNESGRQMAGNMLQSAYNGATTNPIRDSAMRLIAQRGNQQAFQELPFADGSVGY